MIRNILVITPDYPFNKASVFSFVKNLCEEFVRIGCEVMVLSPQSVTSSIIHHKQRRPLEWIDVVDGKEIRVFQPYYLSFPFRYHSINNSIIRFCLKRFFKHKRLKPDAIYGHFWSSGYAVLPYAKTNKLPLFVATGESDINELFPLRHGCELLRDYVKGVICVSSKNRDESIHLGLTTTDKCKVFPNAVNAELFHKYDRVACRNQLGLPQNEYIVAFVGWFIERKGPKRVAEAIQKVGGVKSIFIGKGEQEPQCEGILFKGALPHDKVPFYLGAADVFVLPTLHEGCCNAVVEAMACGLPVVSSNLPFNWDVLDSSNSIMIDPNDVNEIASAIRELKDNPERRIDLAKGALKKAESLTIDRRAKAILDFMESKI